MDEERPVVLTGHVEQCESRFLYGDMEQVALTVIHKVERERGPRLLPGDMVEVVVVKRRSGI